MADNQTQQRDPDVITYESFSGLRNDIPPERFGPADLVVGNNVDLDKSGYLTRRAGYTQQLTLAMHSLWADVQGDICLFVSNGQLMQLSPSYATTTLKTLAANLPTSFEKVNDTVYFSNGIDTGVLANGAVRSWGLPVPPLPGVVATVGNLPAGAYLYTVTYQRVDGQESGAPLAGTVTLPEGSGLNFTLPAPSDPTVTATLLYLSTPNGEVLYLAEAVPRGVTSFAYTDDALALYLPVNTQFLGPAPAGQLVAWYRGRMFVAAGDVIYPSEGYGYELFDLRRYIPCDGRITLLAPMQDREMYDSGKNSGLFIGTDRSCGVLVGGSPEEFQYVPKTDYGAIEGSLALVDASLFADGSTGARQLPMWLTAQGICVGLPEMTVRNLTRSKYQFTASGRGAALFMPESHRFIATSNL